MYEKNFFAPKNPKAEEIKIDNYLRQEWNRIVNCGQIEGMQEEKIVMIKKDYIDNEVTQSVKEHGYRPGLFTQLLQKAIGKLQSFIDFFIFCEKAEKDENGDILIYEDVVLDMTPAALPPREKALKKAKADLAAKEKLQENGEDLLQNRKLYIGAYLRM